MSTFTVGRRLVAEGLGTGLLVAAVVGSGIMADRLTEDAALALLCNALATGAILVVLISIFGPISGAHLNPAVTLVFALRRDVPISIALSYAAAQVMGGIAGTLSAHLMFGLPLLELSSTARTGAGQWFAEVVASFGLIGTILAGLRLRASGVAWLVGLYITAAYWFTASTSFANPAVVIARSLTDTFSGIRPADVAAFIGAELVGGLVAFLLFTWLLPPGFAWDGNGATIETLPGPSSRAQKCSMIACFDRSADVAKRAESQTFRRSPMVIAKTSIVSNRSGGAQGRTS